MEIKHFFYNYLLQIGLSEFLAKYINMFALLIIMVLISFIVDRIIRKIFIEFFTRWALRTKTNFDDLLLKNKVPRRISQVIPLGIVLELNSYVFSDFQFIENIVERTLLVFGIILTLNIFRSLLNTLKDYFKTVDRLKDKPIVSFIQVFMIFAWILGSLSAVAIITGIAFVQFITTIGAASAIILLVFKDTILGFVASIQVSINDMVRIGDWITFAKYGADGTVTEITLSTVKVQNFDKTITTIPTYALISDSFKNWRGMENAEGRRIKRSLSFKMDSVSFLTTEKLNQLKKIESIAVYLETRQGDIDTFNKRNNSDKTLSINGRNLTNLGVFRKYVETYLENHSGINKDMMIMVRQLPPGPQGIPLEIYAFSSDKRWKNYEYIMADIFDHIIAAVSYFELELFELPSNSSFKQL
ncbi:MAG: mechanosensitive ion channel family protein [Flavicella sp.]